MQPLVDIIGKMRREMEARHAAQDKGPDYKTKPTLWRETFNRASCPECNGRAAANCQTCQGSGLVCPACRGASRVRRDEVKEGATFEEATQHCPRCQSLEDKRRGIEIYLRTGGDIWGTVDGEFCAPVEIPMAPRQEQRGIWQEPEAPAEPKRGWLQYTQAERAQEPETQAAVATDVDLDRFTWEPAQISADAPYEPPEDPIPGKQAEVARKFLKRSMQQSDEPGDDVEDLPF